MASAGDSVDIVVVGAGIIGCAVANELAKRGRRVQVVDDRPAGQGATQASAGVLAPYIEAREAGPLLELASASLDLFDDFVAGVGEASGSQIAYRRSGTLDVAMQKAGMERLEEAARFLESRGVAAELLDAEGARREEPLLSADILGGLKIRSHGFVVVADLLRALVEAGTRRGVRFERARTMRIAKSGASLAVETDRGTFVGDRVVLAAGSWSGQIDIDGAASRVPVRPVRGQLLQLSWSAPARLQRVTWGERCYLVPWDDGDVLVGATVEEAGFDERTTVAGVRDLLDAACDLVPQAWTASITAAKVGLRPASTDELPVIGPSAALPNLMYATGHYRNGILLSPLTAKLVADAIVDGRIDLLLGLTSPARFGL